ncbi:asparagine synthase-related protein [Mucilaginibacter jinjuensis]|uniref:asparagine synthase (glutamine-hydrolyzing) n=1 Tax=Mucilaginibacter jinjuensis TaxID=1176721 RepID=A0ABY7T6I7_9SPHI|nr:asparagine synthase-related protein [Mucilaginibacter jinjuensis]WCT11883.1 asparagine synthase-related protein [Mucilaginibacter jinjuensis]
MSVIFGKCHFNNKPIANDELSVMQTRLNHWQADNKGIWINNNVGLGHLMLYNTTPSLTEVLPYHHDGPKLTITADARIDNRDELFGKLGIPAIEKTTIPDSILILKAYEKFGERCTEHLIGDFAFAIWDSNKQQLFCARDQMGVKPFFYYTGADFFAFASEKKGIMAIEGVDLAINKQFLFNQLVFPPEQATDTTLYEHIKKLPPAYTLVLNLTNGHRKLQRYWDLDAETETRFATKAEYHEGLLYHFEQAVQCRSLSHYNVGVELSGGMDSSAITGVANNYLKTQEKNLITFSNTLSDDVDNPEITKLDERRYIDAVLEFNNIKDFVYVTQTAFDNLIDELNFAIEVNDGLERWNPLWQLPLKKSAMEHGVRTLLSGFPGDELVTYRGKYYFMDYLDKGQYLKYFLAKKKYPGFNKVEPFIPHGIKYQYSKLKRSLNVGTHERVKQSFETFNVPDHYRKHLRDCIWLDPVYQQQFKSYRHLQRYRLLKPQVNHRLEAETRFGIYFKTEPRFPMADIRLTQFYLSMPNEYKYEGELTRTFYRNTVSKYLPDMLMKRNDKYGSIAPFLSVNKRITTDEVKNLIKQSPEVAFLSKERFDGFDSPYTPGNSKKDKPYPPVEVLLWLIKNKDKIADL